MGRRSYSGTAVPTVLSGGIGALDLSFTVQDATGYPTGSAGPFYVTLARGVAGEEKILCDSRSGLTFTVNATGRGADGTVATSHAASSTTVEHTITKTDLDEANAHVNDTTGDPHPQYLTATEGSAAYQPLATAGYEVIANVITAGAVGVSFVSIPQTFRHLMLVIAGRSTVAGAADTGFMRLNGDTAANYDFQRIAAAGASASLSAAEGIGATLLQIGDVPGAGAVAGAAGVTTVQIPNYARTDFHKTYTAEAAYKSAHASGGMVLLSYGGAWRNAAAINRIDIGTTTGGYVAGTVATLYGMRGA